MPSKTEGFGVSALEALSAGLPVLVSGNSGLGEALKEVPQGSQFVVDSEDPKEWAKKIKVVQQTKREVRLSESRLLRENYQEKYSWEKPIRRLVERMYSLIFGKLAFPNLYASESLPVGHDIFKNHSFDKELYLTDVVSLFALKGSSGDHSFHSSMEYGQFPFPSTSVSQDNLFQERSHSQSKQNLW
ncbi:unnamed protein product [Pocillopora meandrina]|uniref:Glycosyl transferase family 1 domain-containing protein n=1 Tax=Pocillopora meandrina TaxID=46732 RepID=A0AAU9WNJ4_9CNID|nr:unnamed protein product [Pocillopora meandrina]